MTSSGGKAFTACPTTLIVRQSSYQLSVNLTNVGAESLGASAQNTGNKRPLEEEIGEHHRQD